MRKNYRKYWGTKQAISDRVKRNKARRMMVKAGRAKVGDGKDVGHKTPISRGGKTTKGNLIMQTKKNNRGRSNPRHKKR